MVGGLVSAVVKGPDFKGKGALIRLLLKMCSGQGVRTYYGPRMRAVGGDLTNYFCISGRNTIDYGDVYEAVTTYLRSGSAFIDVGANAGLFSMIAAEKVGETGVVLAFEPSPDIFLELIHNAKLNDLRNFTPFNCAIGSTTSVSRFKLGKSSHSGIGHLDTEGEITVLQVNLKDMSHLLSALIGARDIVIKIDVEGAEVLVLSGMDEILTSPNVSAVIVEIDEALLARFNSASSSIYDVFAERGFIPLVGKAIRPHYNEIFTRG